MPELPEVETTVRDLRRVLPGRVFTGEIVSDWERMFATHPPNVMAQLLAGQAVTDVTRRAKYVIVELTDDRFLVMHRKMTGNLFWREQNAPPDRYTHVVFKFQDSSELRFCDLRKFGRVYMFLSRAELNEHFKKLGPEPLLDTFTLPQFEELITKRKGMLKPLLLDQALVVGLGNIYANEALFVSGIHPQRTPQSLNAREREKLFYAIRQVLETGIENRGTTLSDYLDAGGQRGRNQEMLFVHDREKQPCRTCGTVILRIVVGQRSTYLCPTCQPTGLGDEGDNPTSDI
jgi:formamidopyrimidine-DNA glycosylase